MKPWLMLCILCLSTLASAAPHLLPQSSEALDQQLAATLQSLSNGQLAEARVLARETASRFPKSGLAQLLTAELNSSATQRQVLAGETAANQGKRLQGLLHEARARLHNRPSPAINSTQPDKLPTEVVQSGKAVSALLVVDLADSSLHHLSVNAGTPTLIQQHYVGSGKAGFDKRVEGDNKTPLGVYRIDGYRSDESLPDLYGAGALTLNYPNALDRYLGRTGSGIWLHGVPHAQRSRAPRSSEGCVTMSNDYFNLLHTRLSSESGILSQNTDKAALGSAEPIVLLTHDVQWRDADDNGRQQEQIQFQALFERYQNAWQQRDIAQLIDLYAAPDEARERLQQAESRQFAEQQLLDSVNKRDISIFHNPALASTQGSVDSTATRSISEPMPVSVNNTTGIAGTTSHIVMYMQLGESNEYQLALYWGQNLQGEWQLLTEQWNSVSS